MSNAILIKEVNNSPCIFNVDNATDIARLEALQAVKMAEEMAADIFGENAQYADIMNCSISANPDNPAFPFTVTFNANKIPEKQKRNTSGFVYMNQPSEKYIDVPVSFHVSSGTTWTKETAAWEAPANGFISTETISNNGNNIITVIHQAVILNSKGKKIYADIVEFDNITTLHAASFIPIKKGNQFKLITKYGISVTATIRFYYAEGEI